MANGANVAAPMSRQMEKGLSCARLPRPGSRPPVDAPPGSRAFRVALVNIMPVAAFEDTHRRFSDLIRSGSRGMDLELRCYRLAQVGGWDCPAAWRASYRDVECLYCDPPDALVVTGTEPVCSDLREEDFWSALAELVRWATATVPSALMSCLAAHAALLALDGAVRRPMAKKRSGVFSQAVDRSHVLARGLSTMAAFPHSRWNEVPGSVLRGLGYDVVVGTEVDEWTVAARERAGRMLVLVQGHPEYEPATLLREYRRDLRRFAEGSAPVCPQLPVGYLDAVGEDRLRGWRDAIRRTPPPDWRRDFPLDPLLGHVVPSWSRNANRFFVNWIADARRRAVVLAGTGHGSA
jgi:homoserine O-succinyltransferase